MGEVGGGTIRHGMFAEALTGVSPEPPGFLAHGQRRIAHTIRLLAKHLPERARVMDIGSGAHVSYLVTRALPSLTWIPTDAQGDAAVFTKDGRVLYRYEPIYLLLDANTRRLPEANLDAITLFEVVEHMAWNPAKLFGAVNEGLRNGGLFILSTPNIGSRIAILRLLRGGPPYQVPFFEQGFWYHKREYSPWEMRELIRWAGFDIISHTTYNVTRKEGLSWRAAIHHAALFAAGLLSADLTALRHLIQFSGSTQFLVCRKARSPRWDEPPLAV